MIKDTDIAPAKSDVAAARALLDVLEHLQGTENVTVTIQRHRIRIPAAMIRVLIDAARLISEGHTIDVVAADEEISAQEAADILKVSRPYLLNLVKRGILPCRMVGAHHRIPASAVTAYKREQAPRRRSLEGLVAQTQRLGH